MADFSKKTVVDHLIFNGDDRDRTGNPCLAKAVLSQLSYVPGCTSISRTTQETPIGSGK